VGGAGHGRSRRFACARTAHGGLRSVGSKRRLVWRGGPAEAANTGFPRAGLVGGSKPDDGRNGRIGEIRSEIKE
jgi:hypothetical protein